jgi:hypothetical protein
MILRGSEKAVKSNNDWPLSLRALQVGIRYDSLAVKAPRIVKGGSMRRLAVALPPSPHFLLLHRCDHYNYLDLVLMCFLELAIFYTTHKFNMN